MLQWLINWFFPKPQQIPRTQVFCPGCKNDLVSDDDSRVWEGEDYLIYYSCDECGTQSRWDFDLPVPVLRGIQEA